MKFPSLKRNKKEKPKINRPSYVSLKPRIDNSKILAQAKKRKQTHLVAQRNLSLPESIRKFPFKKAFFVLAILALISCVVIFLKTTSLFNVKDTLVITDKPSDYSSIKSIVDDYKGKNIIFISPSEIKKKIEDKLSSVHTVYVDKSLDGKLKVEVIEDIPIYYEANNTGIYLVNQSGVVMEIVPPETVLTFDDTEKLLLDNKLPADSDQVRIKYLAKLDAAAQTKVIWKDVPKQDKEATLQQMKDDLKAKIDDFTNKLSDQLKEDRYKNLIGSYIPNSQTYKVGDSLSLENLNFVSVVLDFFKSKNLMANKVIWDSNFTLEVQLQDNASVLLTVKRSYSAQFDDLNTLIYHGQFNGAKIVDVRSSNYSVVR